MSTHLPNNPEHWLDLLADRASALRAAGVTRVQVGGFVAEFAPAAAGAPPRAELVTTTAPAGAPAVDVEPEPDDVWLDPTLYDGDVPGLRTVSTVEPAA